MLPVRQAEMLAIVGIAMIRQLCVPGTKNKVHVGVRRYKDNNTGGIGQEERNDIYGET